MEDKPSASALKNRTKRFALDVIASCKHSPRTLAGYIVAKQLVRAATGTAANYRAACRARSATEFASRISVVSEEADESEFWLEIAVEADILCDELARKLLAEAGELTAIFTASRETAKRNLSQLRRQRGSTALALCQMLALLAMLAILAMQAAR